jgi:methoxymalonate biosynthesis acyl carrier protein
MSSVGWIEQVVTEFLESRTGLRPIARDVHLFDSGLVNSLFAIELLIFIETRFGVKVVSEDLDLSRFSTIIAISTFVEEKQRAGGL